MRRLFLSAVLLAVAVAADASSITQLTANVNGGINVRFQLDRAFESEEVLKGLQSGLPTGFTYHVELIRKRPNWFDKRVDRSILEVIATYNSVTNEYLLNYRRDRRLVASETYSDLTALQKRMTSIDEVGLFKLDGHRPQKLRVRVRADVARGFLLSVIPRDISTDWAETRVRHGNAKP